MYTSMSIDTLQISKDLIKAGLEPKPAEALAFKFKQNEDIFLDKKEAEEKLATKQDIAELKLVTKKDIAELKLATKQDIAKLRLEIQQSSNKMILWFSSVMIAGFGGLAVLILKTFMTT